MGTSAGSEKGDVALARSDSEAELLTDRFHHEISAAIVREQLGEILASPMFDASERNRRFLRYIVDETLADRSVHIKGYTVGITVFDRDDTFDPQLDPVVRIEAGRLRRSLERYYLTDGRRATVRISVPKGGYVPRFDLVTAVKAPVSRYETANALGRSIFLLPFTSLSGNDMGLRFAAGLCEELIVEFGKHRELSVFTLPCVAVRAEQAEIQALKTTSVRLVLGGSIRISAGRLRVIAHLVDQVENRHVWSASFDRKLTRTRLTKLEHDIGHEIVLALLARHGNTNRLLSMAMDREASFELPAGEGAIAPEDAPIE